MGCCASTPVVEDELQDRIQTKKEVLQNLSTEGKADALLAMVPGRMFSNGASSNACIFTQQGRKGTNQDAMVVWEVCSIPCFSSYQWFLNVWGLATYLVRNPSSSHLIRSFWFQGLFYLCLVFFYGSKNCAHSFS